MSVAPKSCICMCIRNSIIGKVSSLCDYSNQDVKVLWRTHFGFMVWDMRGNWKGGLIGVSIDDLVDLFYTSTIS